MRRIKTFSALSESASDTPVFQSKIGGYSNPEGNTMVELYGEPDEMKGASVIGGYVEWTLDLRYTKRGIDLGANLVSIKSIGLVMEIENEETGDIEETELEVNPSDLNYEMIETKIHNFPLEMESVEIYLNGSSNPKDWKITLNVGYITD